MNLSKEKFLIKRHSERSHAVAKSKNLGRCVIASLVRGVAISCLLFLAACGDDPKVGGTEEDAGIIAIENKTVSGVSQKGPFVNGSSVKLYEMDGETLAPTGKSFPGKIASDDGRFTVPSISLASQYALLEANGYFRNEITGGKSNGTITLNALTDLSDREKVNINLLTHLEYERALYLVGTGVKVSEAKKQAESEILDAFEIKGEFENSEDLDIFRSGDGNAALLAFSVLMLGNLTEADLTERLTNFATDVEQDGKWDDEKTKAIIADWASGMSLADGLAGIRNNIAGWNFSNDVPAFEKYVNNFWWQNYGLGTCDSKREGEILQASNLLSANNGVHFICNNAAWRVATDLEKDTYKWFERKGIEVAKTSNTVPECVTGSVMKGFVTKMTYECKNGQWLKTYSLNESVEYGKLEDKRDGRIYRTVQIGGRTWMAENLKYADSLSYPSMLGKSWCYDNNPDNCEKFGRLYSWFAAIDSIFWSGFWSGETCDEAEDSGYCVMPEVVQGICPEGWHVMNFSDWYDLRETIGSKAEALQMIGSSVWTNASDDYGFGLMPAGRVLVYENGEVSFEGLDSIANLWASGRIFQWDELCCADNIMINADSYLGSYQDHTNDGLSVRCVKDEE